RAHWVDWLDGEEFYPLPMGTWSLEGQTFAANAAERTRLKTRSGAGFKNLALLRGRRPAWSLDGRVATYTAKGIHLYDGDTGEKAQTLAVDGSLSWWTHMAWSPVDKDRLAISDSQSLWIAETRHPNPSASLREEGARIEVGQLIRALSWSPDGKSLLIGHMFGTHILELETRRLHEGPSYPKIRIQDADWSPTGDRLALSLEDLSVRLFERAPENGAWREKHALRGHIDQIHGSAWHPDGSRIATSSADGTVKLWDPVSGRLAASFHSPVGLHDVSWSPDGRTMTCMDFEGSIVVWTLEIDTDLASGSEAAAPGARRRPGARRGAASAGNRRRPRRTRSGRTWSRGTAATGRSRGA
ncbi:MAG: hypothetical protein AAF368_19180, partial [Planctomycetota bacterium]